MRLSEPIDKPWSMDASHLSNQRLTFAIRTIACKDTRMKALIASTVNLAIEYHRLSDLSASMNIRDTLSLCYLYM